MVNCPFEEYQQQSTEYKVRYSETMVKQVRGWEYALARYSVNSSVVEYQPSKLATWVRFPVDAS